MSLCFERKESQNERVSLCLLHSPQPSVLEIQVTAGPMDTAAAGSWYHSIWPLAAWTGAGGSPWLVQPRAIWLIE